MPTALSDADKVIRNDTGKAIAAALEALAAPEADKVAYDNTSSGLSADDVQDAIDELNTKNNTKMDKTNPTGTGSLSLNRKSGTTTGSYSVTTGYNNEATGVASSAEGIVTTASGDYSHAKGNHSIANHRSQFVFGEYNTADTSTAGATSRGNYIEIVGNGANDANRSNARTLDWSGNETIAGDLTYNGNVSLTRLLNQYYFKTGSPIVISGLSRYETFIVMGFAQSIGTVVIMVTISAGTLDSPINMKTGQTFSNSHLTFTYSSSSNSLTIASDNSNESRLTVIRG